MKDALLIIDMQKVYLPNKQWACKNIVNTINNIEKKIKGFDKRHIFFSKFIASKNPIGTWKDYNKEYSNINSNDYLNDYVDELKKYINSNNSYIKNTYSSLKNNGLYKKLKEYDRIYVTGVVAECCVLSTIFELIDIGKKVIYCKSCISGIDSIKEQSVLNILEELSPIHVEFEY